MRQIVKGVSHLHKLKIVHGDLKPTNILISVPKGDLCPAVKISDFGLFHTESGREKELFFPAFTEGWMSPTDVLDENGERLPSFDIFSLGIIMGFTASKGVLPFGRDLRASISRIKKKKPMLLVLEQLDESVRCASFMDLLVKMVDFDDSKRPTACEILDHEFFNRQPIIAFQQTQNNVPVPMVVVPTESRYCDV